MTYTDDELKLLRTAEFLSTRDVAERAAAAGKHLTESTVRSYRATSRGKLPEPDQTIGTAPGWLAQTIEPWIAALPGRGARTDIAAADRATFTSALKLLLRAGVTSANRDELARGLADGVEIPAMARRVKFGLDKLNPGDLDLDGEERNQLEAAYDRALTILDEPRQAEMRQRLRNAIRRHYGLPEDAPS